MSSLHDAEPDARIDRIEARLAAARNALEAGAVADLDGLDNEVAALRDSLATLPAEQARPLRPRLLAVLDEIDRLAEGLRSGLDRIGRELGDSGRRRQAVSAYHNGQRGKPSGGR